MGLAIHIVRLNAEMEKKLILSSVMMEILKMGMDAILTVQ